MYGKHGVGKTELAASAADYEPMQNVFIIAAEKGDMTVETTERIKNKGKIFEAEINTIDQLESIRKWLIAHCAARDAMDPERLKKVADAIGMQYDENPPVFRTCVIDTISELQAFATYKAKGFGMDISLSSELEKSNWDHYNEILDRMQLVMRAYRDLPMNVIFLAQEQWNQNETKKFVFSPALQGQMSRKIQGFVDIVGFLAKISIADGEDKKEIRRLYIQPTGSFDAKCRVANCTKDHVDNPSMSSLMTAFGVGGTPTQNVPTQPTKGT